MTDNEKDINNPENDIPLFEGVKNFQDHPDYATLPDNFKKYISPKEYAWLGQETRDRIYEDVYPEYVSDEDDYE